MLKINNNKQIFDKIISLSDRLKVWASYFQNDCELSQDEIKKFTQTMNKHIDEMSSLKKEILTHICNCNKE
jgi:hypothetical protein